MTEEQRRYLIRRVDEVLTSKIADVRERLTTLGKEISDDERAILLQTGKVKLKPHITRITDYTEVVDAFDFSKYEYEEKINVKDFDREKRGLRRTANRIKDQIVLGPSEQALKLLEKFENL